MTEQYGNADSCLDTAMKTGLWTGAQAAAISGGLYQLAMKYSFFFRTHFSASARTALVVMPIFYTGYLNAELTMHKCMQPRPDLYYRQSDDDDDYDDLSIN